MFGKKSTKCSRSPHQREQHLHLCCRRRSKNVLYGLFFLLLLVNQIIHFDLIRKQTGAAVDGPLALNAAATDKLSNDPGGLKAAAEPNQKERLLDDRHSAAAAIATDDSPPNRHAKYAYAWVIGGIHPDRSSYKGFLYDVLISVHILRRLGSEADFHLIAQLSHEAPTAQLPPEDVRLLTALGIQIHTLPKPQLSSFAHLVYEKFRPLLFTQYQRVMFLDADIVPLVNLDYLFHLSEGPKPVLQPNLIMATRAEPCNTGMFIMQPMESSWNQLQEIIERQHEQARTLPYPHFDRNEGWGHSFRANGDQWEAMIKKGTTWNYHAAFSDQGLWYYFAKYFLQNVSIVIGERLQTVTPGADGKPHVVENEMGVLSRYAPEPIAYQFNCDRDKAADPRLCYPVYRDFAHFMGSGKPWSQYFCRKCGKSFKLNGPHHLWYETLAVINDELNMGLDMEHFAEKHIPELKDSPLGYVATLKDHAAKVRMPSENKTMDETVWSVPAEPPQQDTDSFATSKKASTAVDAAESNPFTVAYAISFIKCGNWQTDAAGLTDASLILRHSIHKISSRNPASGSKYDYKMYAIVHRDAEACSKVLSDAGFEVVVVEPPVRAPEIRGEFLRKHIHREWCCGADEFIKLYAYTLPEEIVVHVDIDFAFYKPMDDLFDTIRFDKDSPEGRAARERLLLERQDDVLPDKVDMFMTRDWPQVVKWRWPTAGYQAGFMVARTEPGVLDEMVEIIREGNFTEGTGFGSGWGGLGYGGYVDSMAMQGFVAYFYDHHRPNTAVELNQCRFNHMGMDVKFRGSCRNGRETCEDCQTTKMEVRLVCISSENLVVVALFPFLLKIFLWLNRISTACITQCAENHGSVWQHLLKVESYQVKVEARQSIQMSSSLNTVWNLHANGMTFARTSRTSCLNSQKTLRSKMASMERTCWTFSEVTAMGMAMKITG